MDGARVPSTESFNLLLDHKRFLFTPEKTSAITLSTVQEFTERKPGNTQNSDMPVK